MSTVDFSGAEWRKSSRSGDGSGGGCVEVAVARAAVGVRDSKDRGGRHLVFDGAAAWREALRTWC